MMFGLIYISFKLAYPSYFCRIKDKKFSLNIILLVKYIAFYPFMFNDFI